MMRRCIDCGDLINRQPGNMTKHKAVCTMRCSCIGEERCELCITPEDIAEVLAANSTNSSGQKSRIDKLGEENL